MKQSKIVSKILNKQLQTAESGVLTPCGWCGEYSSSPLKTSWDLTGFGEHGTNLHVS
jgi:hypothetical protein